MIGDEVVARRNDRRIRSATTNDFVKNGSAGIVTGIDQKAKRITVAFEHEGPITLPANYLAAGRVEHAYARTSYGVQGTTQDTTHYHPTDRSGFEEGYVAVTRAWRATKIYIVAGTVEADDDEMNHLPPEATAIGLQDIADSLNRRRPNTMAADRTRRLADAVRVSRINRQLDIDFEIAASRDQLADRPPDRSDLIAGLSNAIDGLAARQRLLTADAGSASLSDPESDERCAALRNRLPTAEAALEERLQVAIDQQHEYERWEVEHEPELSRLAVLSATKLAAAHQAQLTAGSATREVGLQAGDDW